MATTAEVKFVEDDGWRPALCVRGREYASCVVADSTRLSVLRVPLRAFDTYPRVPHRGGPYSPQRAAERFLAATRRRHQRLEATKEALRIIRITLDLPADDPDDPPADPPPGQPRAKQEPAVRRSSGPLQMICAELAIAPAAARRALRSAGLRAPYEDVDLIRRTLETHRQLIDHGIKRDQGTTLDSNTSED